MVYTSRSPLPTRSYRQGSGVGKRFGPSYWRKPAIALCCDYRIDSGCVSRSRSAVTPAITRGLLIGLSVVPLMRQRESDFWSRKSPPLDEVLMTSSAIRPASYSGHPGIVIYNTGPQFFCGASAADGASAISSAIRRGTATPMRANHCDPKPVLWRGAFRRPESRARRGRCRSAVLTGRGQRLRRQLGPSARPRPAIKAS